MPDRVVNARVAEALPNGLYRVELLTTGRPSVLAQVDAKGPLLRVLPGDEVQVALASRDAGRGRILRRSE